MLTLLDARAASGNEGWAIGQGMHRVDVATESDCRVVEQSGSVGFGDGFQFVKKLGQHGAVLLIPFLGNHFAVTTAFGVVTRQVGSLAGTQTL